MEHPPVCLSTAPSDASSDDDDAFVALAVSNQGVTYVWQCIRNGTELQANLWATIQIKKQTWESVFQIPSSILMCCRLSDTTDTIFSARLMGKPNGMSVLLVHGTAAFPLFETVRLPERTSKIVNLEIDPAVTSLLGKHQAENDADVRKKQRREAQVVGADNNGEAIQVMQFTQQAHKQTPSASEQIDNSPLKGDFNASENEQMLE